MTLQPDGMGEELAVSGPVFDSFSESNSRDGSVRAGTSYKASPVQVARLKACLEEVAAGRASVSAEPGTEVSARVERAGVDIQGAEADVAPAPIPTVMPLPVPRHPASQSAPALSPRQSFPAGPSPELLRLNSNALESVSSYELATGSRGGLDTNSLRTPSDLGSAQMHEMDPVMLPLHWRQAVDDSDVPRSAFLDHPSLTGAAPSARFGHAHAAIGDRLFVFGGDGPGGMLNNAFVYDAVQDSWKALPVPSPRSEDALPTMTGHAACAVSGKIYMYGGRTGRKQLRRTYIFDTERGVWRCPKKSPTDPPGLSGLSLTTVGRRGIYLFGGVAKKPSNAVYSLDPDTLAWSSVDTKGERPVPRQAHTAVWDFSDSLIVFGGLGETSVFNDVHVLSLSTGYWSKPACMGQPPALRYGHSAAMVASNLMLVFGGANARGMFYNDLHVLNTSTFCWHRLAPVGALPTARYGQACATAGGRVVVHGGSNGTHTFDSLFTISMTFGRDFNSAVAGLRQLLSGPGSWRTSESSSGGGSTKPQSSEDGTDATRQQLADLLHRRAANDLQAFAARRADISEGLLQKERQQTSELQAEVAELKLLLEEQSNASEIARETLRQERASVRRTQQNHLRHMEENAAETQRLQRQCSQLQAQYDALQAQVQSLQKRFAAANAAAEATQQENNALQQRLRTSNAQLAAEREEQARVKVRLKEAQEQATRSAKEATAVKEQLLREQQLRAAAVEQQRAEADRLSRNNAELAGLPNQAASGSQGLTPRMDSVRQLACLQGSTVALSKCSLSELYSLEGTISGACRALREAIITRGAAELRLRETELAERERAAEEATLCSLCMERPKAVAFGCGHQTCSNCSDAHQDSCPFCRQPISSRIRLFHT